ncbi:hypothetical protein KGQ34_03400 [Patescibacteria group bacterium]|nr:hypothetical protein [Patescibacteria group bacterium]
MKIFFGEKPLKRIIIDIICIVGLVFFDTIFLILFKRSIFSLIPYFDKTLHFITGMLLADIYYCLPFKKNIFRIVMFVLAVSIAWESVEPLLDTTSPFLTLSWLVDTIGDTASAIFGGMIYGFFKKHGDKFTPVT